ncbi:hypothetical protein AAFF_G00370100 [Aldrovandia affinis]|uniref:Uncharacterized protein n=1 Tax=Aldrovandia affinis TaxID=143900 RepID=A0AAD7SGP5_9TELE|nr:hypothetical protein AAFF_G00370100 [Aldrovandia affinis]
MGGKLKEWMKGTQTPMQGVRPSCCNTKLYKLPLLAASVSHPAPPRPSPAQASALLACRSGGALGLAVHERAGAPDGMAGVGSEFVQGLNPPPPMAGGV